MASMEDDVFDSLLGLEDQYYKDGYDLGVRDGSRAGLIEGRLFGLEKGFEKYAVMGKLHGQATIWAQRLPALKTEEGSEGASQENREKQVFDDLGKTNNTGRQPSQGEEREGISTALLKLPPSARLEKHIRTLYALAEPSSLSTENNEESVSQFDDRLKRAQGKAKIIEKMIGEAGFSPFMAEDFSPTASIPTSGQSGKGEVTIED